MVKGGYYPGSIDKDPRSALFFILALSVILVKDEHASFYLEIAKRGEDLVRNFAFALCEVAVTAIEDKYLQSVNIREEVQAHHGRIVNALPAVPEHSRPNTSGHND